MNRRNRIDAVIVGGGVVGTACALALAARELQVALVEAGEAPHWSAAQRDLRVYAFAPDNAQLLDALGVWNAVRNARAQAYRHMRVWDAGGQGELSFHADALGRSELGWIVEHGLLAEQLWRALPVAGVAVHSPARVQACVQSDDGVRLQLDDGTRIDARMAVAADGADSSVRALLGIGVESHDYAQRGVVGFVSSERPHQDTAWQRFLPGGPLALLPFADGDSSFVWTLPEDEAARILALDDAGFARALERASEFRLGTLHATSPRAAFPLRRQLTQAQAQERVVLVGDAAHVVHPLAGQGVNLGLRDVADLAQSLTDAQARGVDFAAPQRLRRWARRRRSENTVAAYGFDAINRMFSNDALLPTLLRGPLLGLAGRVPALPYAFWRRAAGV